MIGGGFRYLNGAEQIGAFEPQPSAFAQPGPGITADLHLISILSNFAHGYLQSDAARAVDNLVIVTANVPPGRLLRKPFMSPGTSTIPRSWPP